MTPREALQALVARLESMDGFVYVLTDTYTAELAAAKAVLQEPEGGAWTPKEAKLLTEFRNAHAKGDDDETYNAIYWLVADRAADKYNPWAEVEALEAALHTSGKEGEKT